MLERVSLMTQHRAGRAALPYRRGGGPCVPVFLQIRWDHGFRTGRPIKKMV